MDKKIDNFYNKVILPRIPYTKENSFFYVKDSNEPLPFMTIAHDKVDYENTQEPMDHSDFLRNLGKGIRNLRNNQNLNETGNAKVKKLK